MVFFISNIVHWIRKSAKTNVKKKNYNERKEITYIIIRTIEKIYIKKLNNKYFVFIHY
jgi:hypothetical protein